MLTLRWTSNGNGPTKKYKVSIPFGFLISGWLFMLLMGILHLNVLPVLPAIGYGLSTLIMFIVQMISLTHSGIGD